MIRGQRRELRGPEEHRDDREAVVAERGALQHAISTAHLGCLALKSGGPPVEWLHKGHSEGTRVVAGIADDGEVVPTGLAARECHVLGVDSDEVLGVAHARPAAVI